MKFYWPKKSDIDWGVAEVNIRFFGSIKLHIDRTQKSITVLLYELNAAFKK